MLCYVMLCYVMLQEVSCAGRMLTYLLTCLLTYLQQVSCAGRMLPVQSFTSSQSSLGG